MADEEKRRISRRDLLKGAGIAGAAAILPPALQPAAATEAPLAAASASMAAGVSSLATAPRPRRYENLTAQEAELLEAIMGRLIPDDQFGPGAIQAGAINYVDRALGGFLSSSREVYRAGLAAFDRYCRMSRGAPFVELSAVDKDSALIDCEIGAATGSGAGFSGSSGAFFSMVKNHTWQGMFGDPYYGGNANLIGWELIRYPGIRTAVSAEDQRRMEARQLPINGRSAYDSEMFEKAMVRGTPVGGNTHGD
jgi:gluconate 2-dehydrogenase gamma chain